MSIKIQLSEGQILVIHADADEWAKAFQRALNDNSGIEVHGADGRTLAINPHQILFWEEAPEDSLSPDPAPEPQAA